MISNIGALLFCLPFLIIGIGLTHWGWKHVQKLQNMNDWPVAPGKVIESRVMQHQEEHQVQYGAMIRYEFEADGDKREGMGISYEDSQSFYKMSYENDPDTQVIEYDGSSGSINKEIIEKITEQYPVGKAVKVYYNPDDHYRAVLQPKMPMTEYLPMIGGLAFILVASALLFAVIYL